MNERVKRGFSGESEGYKRGITSWANGGKKVCEFKVISGKTQGKQLKYGKTGEKREEERRLNKGGKNSMELCKHKENWGKNGGKISKTVEK